MITPISPVVIPPYPTSTVQPFTYKDGLSYLDRLEMLQKYINRILIPFVNDSYNELSSEVQDQINSIIVAFNAAVDTIINSNITVQDPIVATLINNAASETRIAIQALLDGKVDDATFESAIGSINTVINGRLSINGLDSRYIGFAVWNGISYVIPDPRPTIVIFIGPEYPGLAQNANDIWPNPDATTLASVTAAILDSSTAIYAAVKKAHTRETMNLLPGSSDIVGASFGTSPNNFYAYAIPKGGIKSIRWTGKVPDGWNTFNIVAEWGHDAAGDSIRANLTYRVLGDTAVPLYSDDTTQNYTSRGPGIPNKIGFSNRPTAGGRTIVGTFNRLSDAGSDTIAGPIGIITIRLEFVA